MSSQDQNKTGKAPTHTVYSVKEKEGQEKPIWLRVGVAWEHADEEGLNLSLNNLGQDVSLTIRKNKPMPHPS